MKAECGLGVALWAWPGQEDEGSVWHWTVVGWRYLLYESHHRLSQRGAREVGVFKRCQVWVGRRDEDLRLYTDYFEASNAGWGTAEYSSLEVKTAKWGQERWKGQASAPFMQHFRCLGERSVTLIARLGIGSRTCSVTAWFLWLQGTLLLNVALPL